jgi:hypothetical protein
MSSAIYEVQTEELVIGLMKTLRWNVCLLGSGCSGEGEMPHLCTYLDILTTKRTTLIFCNSSAHKNIGRQYGDLKAGKSQTAIGLEPEDVSLHRRSTNFALSAIQSSFSIRMAGPCLDCVFNHDLFV